MIAGDSAMFEKFLFHCSEDETTGQELSMYLHAASAAEYGLSHSSVVCVGDTIQNLEPDSKIFERKSNLCRNAFFTSGVSCTVRD